MFRTNIVLGFATSICLTLEGVHDVTHAKYNTPDQERGESGIALSDLPQCSPSRSSKLIRGLGVRRLAICLHKLYVLRHVTTITARSVNTAEEHIAILTRSTMKSANASW